MAIYLYALILLTIFSPFTESLPQILSTPGYSLSFRFSGLIHIYLVGYNYDYPQGHVNRARYIVAVSGGDAFRRDIIFENDHKLYHLHR